MITTHKSIPINRIEPWLVVFSASLFFFFAFMQINLFNALNSSLYRDFHLTDATALGNFSATYMYATVLLLFPAGIILDRVSTRKVIIIAMTACVFCTGLFSFTNNLWQAELCRLVTGAGGAFCFLSCVRLASRWFESKHMALIVGLIVTFAMTGAMLAQTPFTALTNAFGWRNALRIDATAGLLMLWIILLYVRDYPSGAQPFFEAQHAALEKIGFWPALRSVAINAQNWLGGLYVSLVNLPVFLLGSTWGSWYLIQTHHLTEIQSSLVISALFVGMIIGSPVVGWISDTLEQRRAPMMAGAIVSLAAIAAIMYLPNLGLIALLFAFFALGFVISFQILGYPLIAESNPSALTGTAEGLASVLIMAGGFFIPVFPMLLNSTWDHRMQNGIPLYTTVDYHHAFMIMPIAFVLSFIIAFFAKETCCLSFEARTNSTTLRMECCDVAQ